MPRLAHVRVRMSLQENLLQLVHGKVGEMHLLLPAHRDRPADRLFRNLRRPHSLPWRRALRCRPDQGSCVGRGSEGRSEEHTSELQSLMRTSYAVFCLKNKKTDTTIQTRLNDK